MSSSIDFINNTNLVYYQRGQNNLGNSRMDREGFIRLILAQLQYQDPLNPKDNSEMLNQQLMLEQADQMKSLVDSNTFAQATGLIGKEVSLMDAPWSFELGASTTPEYDPEIGGPKQLTNVVVEGVQFDRNTGKALVKINGKYYDSALIYNVQNPTTQNPQT
ncbi:MAG TPA: flagellar hook capping FlgD N-terminal domain-containing protein [Oculatellaceae cyanobacterium]|jgi:flagellar hook assembly protein FlgD